ncbi:MAG: hypothetical protein UIH27_10985 [Ruminococcus sp.]|nr:hypothetical protein [Ruminococcus sp.]
MAVTFDSLKTTLLTAVRMGETSANQPLIDELHEIYSACLDDLKGAGVDVSKNEGLVRQAIIFYCKANFGLELDEKWQKQYEKTRDALGSRTSEIEEAEA